MKRIIAWILTTAGIGYLVFAQLMVAESKPKLSIEDLKGKNGKVIHFTTHRGPELEARIPKIKVFKGDSKRPTSSLMQVASYGGSHSRSYDRYEDDDYNESSLPNRPDLPDFSSLDRNRSSDVIENPMFTEYDDDYHFLGNTAQELKDDGDESLTDLEVRAHEVCRYNRYRWAYSVIASPVNSEVLARVNARGIVIISQQNSAGGVQPTYISAVECSTESYGF